MEPFAAYFCRFFVRHRELAPFNRRCQVFCVEAKGDFADVIEREALEYVLEVKGPVLLCGRSHDGEEAVGEFGIDHLVDEFAERLCIEFVAGDLSLELPSVAIGVEDPRAEEIGEGAVEGIALLVVGEAGLENMLHGCRVASEDLETAQWAVEGECGGG